MDNRRHWVSDTRPYIKLNIFENNHKFRIRKMKITVRKEAQRFASWWLSTFRIS